MKTAKKSPPKFRVGDWVALLYGPRTVLAQVIEDRGPLGVRGRRLYSICLDPGKGEATTLEVPEEDLEAATEVDRVAWRDRGTIALHQTLTYYGKEESLQGKPRLLDHYLVVAKPGPEPGSGAATITSLSERRAGGAAQEPFHTVIAQSGGPEAALAKAEKYLDARHPGSKKTVGEKKP